MITWPFYDPDIAALFLRCMICLYGLPDLSSQEALTLASFKLTPRSGWSNVMDFLAIKILAAKKDVQGRCFSSGSNRHMSVQRALREELWTFWRGELQLDDLELAAEYQRWVEEEEYSRRAKWLERYYLD